MCKFAVTRREVSQKHAVSQRPGPSASLGVWKYSCCVQCPLFRISVWMSSTHKSSPQDKCLRFKISSVQYPWVSSFQQVRFVSANSEFPKTPRRPCPVLQSIPSRPYAPNDPPSVHFTVAWRSHPRFARAYAYGLPKEVGLPKDFPLSTVPWRPLGR